MALLRYWEKYSTSFKFLYFIMFQSGLHKYQASTFLVGQFFPFLLYLEHLIHLKGLVTFKAHDLELVNPQVRFLLSFCEQLGIILH